MQIKATVRYHLIPVRMAISKERQEITSVDEGMKTGELVCTVGGDVNWYSNCGKQYGGSLTN